MEHPTVNIGGRAVGAGHPVFVIAEIGINHNGSVSLAKKLIDGAHLAGCDAVKFQKRTPERCVPAEQWNVQRDTPWGRMSYIEYRRMMEFGLDAYADLDRHCRERGMMWFASCWDEESVDFIRQFDPPCYKIASASLTDHALLRHTRATGTPVMLSTGMSTMAEIDNAVAVLGRERLLIAHATSTYPCPPTELNLRMIDTLRQRFAECPVGYSGHETGLAPTWAAVALGATFVERHITLDRAMWGTDHAGSVEIPGLMRLVSQIRDVEHSMGTGVKIVYESERGPMVKLRRIRAASGAIDTTLEPVRA